MPKRIVTDAPTAKQSQELRAIRAHVGCSQRCFAVCLGVTPRSLSRWERGGRPVPTTVLSLARLYALGAVPPVQFLPDADDPDTPRIELAEGAVCLWPSAAGACRGTCYTFTAQISRRRSVFTEVYAAHAWKAYQMMD